MIKRPMGIGMTVYSVINAFNDPTATGHTTPSKHVWEASGRKLAANGAVMRTAITAVPRYHSRDAVIEDTVGYARTTHFDPRSVASCVAVAVALADMLCIAASAPVSPRHDGSGHADGSDRSHGEGHDVDGVARGFGPVMPAAGIPALIDTAASVAEAWLASQETELASGATVSTGSTASTSGIAAAEWTGFSFDSARRELRQHLAAPTLAALALDDDATIGYTYKCLGAAFHCLRSLAPDATTVADGAAASPPPPPSSGVAGVDSESCRGFVPAICDLVAEGGDADTNGAVAGALLGCFLGYDELVAQVSGLGWQRLGHCADMLEPRLAALRTAMGLDE